MTINKWIHLATLFIASVILYSPCFILYAEAATVTLPETGQKLCYDLGGSVIPCSGTGQDGSLRKGATWPTPRFTNIGDGTVTDNLTGVVWLKNANCNYFNSDSIGNFLWVDALGWSNLLASGSCGLSDNSRSGDWRLPNRNELESLVDLSRYYAALPSGNPFINVQSDVYWSSSTTYADGTGSAWGVNMYDGGVDSYFKGNYYFVWPVRVLTFADLIITPNLLDFGAVQVGSSSAQTITLTNPGTATLSISSNTATPENVFTLSLGSCNSLTPTIDPKTNCTIDVICTPSGVVTVNSTLIVQSNAFGGTQTIPLSCTGTAPPIYTATGERTSPNGTITPASQSVVSGDTATFTITPNPGYETVTPLGGTCPPGSFDSKSYNYYVWPITTDCTVIASFSQISTYTITATAGANGSITPSGATSVSYNGSQSYGITPTTGYHIADVLVDGVTVGAVTSYTFSSIAANHTIAASFAINSYTITATAGTNGSITPTGIANVSYNGSQSYSITPTTGYHIADVLVDGVTVGAVTSYTFSSIAASHTIAASFAINSYTITATAGTNGSITPSGATSITYNGSQSYGITPATGYHITDVLVDGVTVGTVAGYTFSNVMASHTISASFAINSYTITATAGANGSITPVSTTNVSYNGSQSYSITPATGYHVADVLVDGLTVGAVTGYTFSNVIASHTISASFADITPPVITPTPEQIYNEATSNKIYRIAGTVTDVSSVTVTITVDGIIYTPPVAPDGSYFQDVPLDAEKAYQITITATDAMGLKSQQFRTVVYSTVTIADALRAYKIAQGFIIPTKPGDFNLLDVAPLGTDGKPLGNGKIDLFDVLSLLSKSIGLGY